MDADGSNQRRLTSTKDLNETSPAWAPGGSVIAYQRGQVVDNAQGTGVFLINTDGSCSTEIAFDLKLNVWYANPAWHPTAAADGACAAETVRDLGCGSRSTRSWTSLDGAAVPTADDSGGIASLSGLALVGLHARDPAHHGRPGGCLRCGPVR